MNFLYNPGGPFRFEPLDAPLGAELKIMFGEQQWATTRNPACAAMIVAAMNRDHKLSGKK